MKKGQPSPTPQPVKTSTAANQDQLLSLVIPCYNESKRTDLLLAGLRDFDEKWKGDYEVIIVDDGSSDDTGEKLKEALDSKYDFLKDRVTITKMPKNGGKGSALKHGVSLANGDYILTLDADMSTKPAELINWQKKEKDLFSATDTIYIGSRRHEEGKVEALQSRKLVGGVFNGIVQIFTSLHLKDTQCGFKLYPRNVAKLLFANMQSKGWAHDVELLYQADLNDVKIKEMPISWVNQPESKVHVVKDSILMFIGVLSIALRIWLYNSFILPFRIDETATKEQREHIIFRSVFNIICTLLVIGMPIMSFQYAVTGDEHWHFDYGNDIYKYFFQGDTTAQTATSGIQYYGGLFDFITAYVYNVFHIWDHYTTMHFINALVGAIGIIFAGKLAKLLGGWSAAILTVIFLVLSPSWFGHNFANPKDIPFSVGYTAGIYYILLFLKALPHPNSKHVFGLICSIGWAMGVRIGGLLLIAYLVLFIGIYAVYTRQFKAIINIRLIKQIFIVSVAGYLIAIICWPWAHLGIVSQPLEALKIMSNFFINIGLLYDGNKIMSNQVPWFYIPKYVLYTAPVIVLAGSVIGIISIPVIFRKNKQLLLFAILLIFTCVFPVAYAIHKKSSLYDGWRHFLFIYPPLVIICSLGFSALFNSRNKIVGFAVAGLIAAGLVLPLRFAMANHPYESLYYNEIAGGLKNIYGKYETDYYMLGIKEATEWLLKNEHLDDKKATIGTNCTYPLVATLYKSHYKKLPFKYDRIYEQFADFRHDEDYQKYDKQYPDFKDPFAVAPVYLSFYQRYNKDWDYFIMFSRFVDASQLTTGNWPPPETIYTVKVDGVPIAAVLKRKTHKDFAAFQLMKEKKYAEAKSMFLESLQEYPNNELVWEALSELYNAEGNTDSAIYAGRQTLKTYPGDVSVFEAMGSAWMKQKKTDSAINCYMQLVKYNPAYGHYFLGYTQAMLGNAAGAFSEIDQSIEADPYNQAAYKLGLQIAQQTKNNAKLEEYNEKVSKAFPQKEE